MLGSQPHSVKALNQQSGKPRESNNSAALQIAMKLVGDPATGF